MDNAAVIRNLEALLAQGKESALLRFSLGNEYLKAGERWVAIYQLRRAIEIDPAYSAAWKILGKALTDAGLPREALETYRKGIEVAEKRGDKQVEREMSVFAARLEKQLGV